MWISRKAVAGRWNTKEEFTRAFAHLPKEMTTSGFTESKCSSPKDCVSSLKKWQRAHGRQLLRSEGDVRGADDGRTASFSILETYVASVIGTVPRVFTQATPNCTMSFFRVSPPRVILETASQRSYWGANGKLLGSYWEVTGKLLV